MDVDPTQQIQNLEVQIGKLKQQEVLGKLAEKLALVPEFKTLIMDEFMTAEVVRNCAISGDPSLDEKQRADALAMAQAGGHLKRYLQAQVVMGRTAQKEIKECESLIDELNAIDSED
jgi:hypothetical protein